ncbi:MAG: competence/damage-inducible protein A [Eubacteriaceae bacterium]|jgi:nicotinamide-nucleotide amidase|nr:competence/damage-inducible protein A [Eubacteriaceae bacterium]
MKAEIITIGTELLTGDTINTNSHFLTKDLSIRGVSVYYHTTIGDNYERGRAVLKAALQRSDLIIFTGGLGPTQDDMTKEMVADTLNLELLKVQKIEKQLIDYFKKRNYPITENNFKQAYVPEGAETLPNDNGTAPGIYIHLEETGQKIFLLPGPPGEMKTMYTRYVTPHLNHDVAVIPHYYGIIGVGESQVEDRLLDIIEGQTNPTIATYAKNGEVMLRLTAKGKNKNDAEQKLLEYDKIVRERFEGNIFTNRQESIETVVSRLLMAKKLRIAVAESCTGGLIASRFTRLPGISKVFDSGIVVYSNQAKRDFLQVKEETLEKYGAVSKETAKEMSENLRQLRDVDIAISTTGIAGPDGGNLEKPVGLVYVGIATAHSTEVSVNVFSGDRLVIQNRSAKKAFQMIYDIIKRESTV